MFCSIALLLVLKGEMFQKHLDTFMDESYYVDYDYYGVAEREELIGNIQTVCEDNKVNVYALLKYSDGAGSYKIQIFADDMGKELLQQKGLKENCYKSLFSGNTTIEYSEFEKVKTEQYIERFYFLGDKSNVKTAINDLFELAGKTRAKRNGEDLDTKLIYAIWFVVFSFGCILTLFDISLQKKEVLIKISVGESIWRIIAKNVINDIAFIIIVYNIAKLIVSKFEYLEYLNTEFELALVIFMFINSLLYLYMLKNDIKRALMRRYSSEGLRGNCYVIKVFSMMILIAVVGTNMITIKESYNIVRQDDTMQSFSEYEFVDFVGYISDRDYMEPESYKEMLCELFYRNYTSDNVAMATKITEDEDGNQYMCINDNADDAMKSLLDSYEVDSTYDIHIFVPKEKIDKLESIHKDAIELVLAEVYMPLINEGYEVIYYDGDPDILCFDREFRMNSEYVEQPVIIYLDVENTYFDEAAYIPESGGALESCQRHIMYKNSEELYKEISEKYNLVDYGLKIETTNSIDKYNYYRNQMIRTMIINVIVSGFIIILNIMLISVIIRLEYISNADELAIKKIMGYSIFERHRKIFGLSGMSTVLGILTLLAINLYFDFMNFITLCILGLIVMLLEWAIIGVMIIGIEKTDVVKVLKGGAI